MQLRVENLKKHFGLTKAVDDISFSLESGHVFGFVGPNGAGKTTTLRILASLDDPTSGDAYLDGVSITEMPESVRRRIGFVPDALPSHSDVTVHEYLDFFARAYGMVGKAKCKAVEGVEDFTSVRGIRDKLLKSLSKGMKQRVSLGRALIHDPDLLIMDEPAAGLDPRARVEFRELVTALSDMDKAILISSHILTELAEICTGVVIIEQGKLLRTGTMGDVLMKDIPHQTVAIKAMEKQGELSKALLELPHVKAVQPFDKELHVEIEGGNAECSELLGELVRRGHQVVEFRHVRDDLEDVFMRVTKGEVQ